MEYLVPFIKIYNASNTKNIGVTAMESLNVFYNAEKVDKMHPRFFKDDKCAGMAAHRYALNPAGTVVMWRKFRYNTRPTNFKESR
jgi:alpha-glucuronidase